MTLENPINQIATPGDYQAGVSSGTELSQAAYLPGDGLVVRAGGIDVPAGVLPNVQVDFLSPQSSVTDLVAAGTIRIDSLAQPPGALSSADIPSSSSQSSEPVLSVNKWNTANKYDFLVKEDGQVLVRPGFDITTALTQPVVIGIAGKQGEWASEKQKNEAVQLSDYIKSRVAVINMPTPPDPEQVAPQVGGQTDFDRTLQLAAAGGQTQSSGDGGTGGSGAPNWMQSMNNFFAPYYGDNGIYKEQPQANTGGQQLYQGAETSYQPAQAAGYQRTSYEPASASTSSADVQSNYDDYLVAAGLDEFLSNKTKGMSVQDRQKFLVGLIKANPQLQTILSMYENRHEHGQKLTLQDVKTGLSSELKSQFAQEIRANSPQNSQQAGDRSNVAGGNHQATEYGLKIAEIAKTVSAAPGKCATADQILNEKLGHPELSYIGNAWDSRLKYDKSPYVERVALSEMAPGDKLIRKWSDETNSREGNKDYGDVMTVTRITSDGRIFGTRGLGEEEIKLDNPRYSQKSGEMLAYRLLPTTKDHLANNNSQLS